MEVKLGESGERAWIELAEAMLRAMEEQDKRGHGEW